LAAAAYSRYAFLLRIRPAGGRTFYIAVSFVSSYEFIKIGRNEIWNVKRQATACIMREPASDLPARL
jgi:hypothetical protein